MALCFRLRPIKQRCASLSSTWTLLKPLHLTAATTTTGQSTSMMGHYKCEPTSGLWCDTNHCLDISSSSSRLCHNETIKITTTTSTGLNLRQRQQQHASLLECRYTMQFMDLLATIVKRTLPTQHSSWDSSENDWPGLEFAASSRAKHISCRLQIKDCILYFANCNM